jgi:UDP-N-acetylglucosamine/UDP-N-acetylgalactosamine diphosphorylase
MARNVDERLSVLRERAARHGQEQLFRFWHALDDAARAELLHQIEDMPFDRLARLIAAVKDRSAPAPLRRPLLPAPFVPLEESRDPASVTAIQSAGEEALRAGRVAALVVAGGQGTRLGYPGAKGTLPIGPLSGKSLYQLHAEKILAIGRRFGRPLRWYLLTSEATHDETRAFFERRRYFGVPPDRVRFLLQGMVPAVDPDGRILMESPHRIACSPNGHGGVVDALGRSGALRELREAGIDLVFYFQVDNPLVRIADPLFLGYHLLRGAELSIKVVRKRRPEEKVGVLVREGPRFRMVEYSELRPEEASERLPDGSLRFQAGNIAIHVFSRSFLERLARDPEALPYHTALKKVPHIDADGTLIEPAVPNAYKFEKFVFDALPLTERVVVLEVAREEEFSPVKNASGSESAATAQSDLMALHRRWLREAGAAFCEPAGEPRVEVSPLFAIDAAELRERLRERPITVADGLHLEAR